MSQASENSLMRAQPEADRWEAIHVAEKLRVDEQSLRGASDWSSPAENPRYMLRLAVLLAGIQVCQWAARLVNIGGQVVVLVAVGGVVAVDLVRWFQKRRRAKLRSRGEDAGARDGEQSNPSIRLRLVGPGHTVNALAEGIDAKQGGWSEPTVFRAITAIKVLSSSKVSPSAYAKPNPRLYGKLPKLTGSSRWSGAQWGVFAVLFLLTLAAYASFSYFVLHDGYNISFLNILGSGAVAYYVMSHLTPTYVRVAPGILDILKFGWLTANDQRCIRIDLRRARVLADAGAQSVIVYDDAGTVPDGYILRAQALNTDFAELAGAILHAARTDQPVPELPKDALTG
jgi:hypothetical protein